MFGSGFTAVKNSANHLGFGLSFVGYCTFKYVGNVITPFLLRIKGFKKRRRGLQHRMVGREGEIQIRASRSAKPKAIWSAAHSDLSDSAIPRTYRSVQQLPKRVTEATFFRATRIPLLSGLRVTFIITSNYYAVRRGNENMNRISRKSICPSVHK
ncbi:hypothetical protein K440DRAFT_172186 [Wilcoxina mikolae CBS 423.85]|nr:hypothetical protein K440DRAFT_172186 [Wilcoxina mikolae CBS 423.85]